MASEPVLIPVSVCEVCWLIDHTDWEPESMTSEGKVIMRLIGVDVPEKVNTSAVDICAECGGITIAGIYELRDSSTVETSKDEARAYSEVYEDATSFVISLTSDDDGDDYE